MARRKPYASLDWHPALIKLRGGRMSFTNAGPEPWEVERLYRGGFVGARNSESMPSDIKTRVNEVIGNQPRLYDVFPWAKGKGAGKIVAPYEAILKYVPTWGGDEAQTVGSCVSHGKKNAGMIDYCLDALIGEAEFKGRLASENIYRHRGYNSHGWWCREAAATTVDRGPGGFIFRKRYPSVDLTTFSSSTERWASAGSSGVPRDIVEAEQENQAMWCPLITTIEEYRDALWLGFGINVCSGYGFSNSTDEYGVARKSGSWAHAMAHCGYNDSEWANRKYRGTIGLIVNSWGRWNRINGHPEGSPKLVPGSFYAEQSNLQGMLRGQDSFAVAQLPGYERGDLFKHLKSSSTQDYYKTRQERLAELSEQAAELVAI